MNNPDKMKIGPVYMAKYKKKVALDTLGREWPNLSDTPFGTYEVREFTGNVTQRDKDSRLIMVEGKTVVSYDDVIEIWEESE